MTANKVIDIFFLGIRQKEIQRNCSEVNGAAHTFALRWIKYPSLAAFLGGPNLPKHRTPVEHAIPTDSYSFHAKDTCSMPSRLEYHTYLQMLFDLRCRKSGPQT